MAPYRIFTKNTIENCRIPFIRENVAMRVRANKNLSLKTRKCPQSTWVKSSTRPISMYFSTNGFLGQSFLDSISAVTCVGKEMKHVWNMFVCAFVDISRQTGWTRNRFFLRKNQSSTVVSDLWPYRFEIFSAFSTRCGLLHVTVFIFFMLPVGCLMYRLFFNRWIGTRWIWLLTSG